MKGKQKTEKHFYKLKKVKTIVTKKRIK